MFLGGLQKKNLLLCLLESTSKTETKNTEKQKKTFKVNFSYDLVGFMGKLLYNTNHIRH